MDGAGQTQVAAPAAPQKSVRVTFGALMLVTFLASLDGTIVSTALPTIVGELGDLQHLSWIVTAYMLAQTIATPLFGKLGDLFGRKIILQSAIILFIAGSVLSGFSRSMGELIVFRALQGFGGGGLIVCTMAAVADIIPPRDRGRYQGYFGAVYGLSTVLGPLVGGFFVEHLNWRWIFYINVPLGILALVVIKATFSARSRMDHRPKIDVAGALLIAIMLSALVTFTSLGGVSFAWTSPIIISLILITTAALAAFIFVEQHAAEPILPLKLFTNSTFLLTSIVGFIASIALFGSTTYLPVYLQVVQGVSPSTAGLQLTPMMAGVLLTSIIGGQYISRTGKYRILPIVGTAAMSLSLLLLSILDRESGTWAASCYALLLGIGIGLVMQVLVLAVQNAVDYRDLGVATSGSALFRMTGGSVGVALFGAIFAANLASGLAAQMPDGITMSTTSSPAAVAALSPDIRALYRDIFSTSLQPVFLFAAIATALACALTFSLKNTPLQSGVRPEPMAESFGRPHDATSLQELASIVARMGQRENGWEVYRRIASNADVQLAPDEMWLLGHICREPGPIEAAEIARRFSGSPTQISDIANRLDQKNIVKGLPGGKYAASDEGRRIYDRVAEGYRNRAADFLKRWSPEENAEVQEMLARLARNLLTNLPVEFARS